MSAPAAPAAPPEPVDYECLLCGAVSTFHANQADVRCQLCGGRQFSKLRRQGVVLHLS